MTAFVHNPQRDAYKAIKGFYYQVELTVIRWLELPADTVLYCECGEDIDRVKQLLDADQATQVRILEQVKTRDRITLRSQEALTALARFREAVANNPSLHILYQFSTTAIPVKERGLHFPRHLTGIESWNRVRGGTLGADETQAFIVALKDLVALSSCPQDLQESVFLRLQEYIATVDPQTLIDKFIRRFEWATGLPDAPQLRSQIQSLLVRQPRAHQEGEARLLADLLTAHVFHLLTRSGEKRLTVEDLERLLLEKSITELDRRILTRLINIVEQAAAYFPEISSQIESVLHGVAALQGIPAQLGQLAQHVSGIQTQFLPVHLPLPDELPICPPIFTKRGKLVGDLLRKLSGVTSLNITGAVGMGKTSAAYLLAERHSLDRTIWISLRGEQSSAEIVRHLEMHLLRVASAPDRGDLVGKFVVGAIAFSDLVTHVSVRLADQGLLVIDEVPDLLELPLLADRLVELTLALRASGAKLLTTSQRSIPPSVVQHLETTIAESAIPPMAEQEIDELLTSAGAPSELHHPGYLTLILAKSSGHPALIVAIISSLRSHRWSVDDVSSFLIEDPTKEVRAETRRKLIRLLPNDNARELLYRLSLIGAPFDTILMRAVAAVSTPIPRPAELFPEVTGPWVYRLAADRFEVSPLLSDAGQATLDPGVRQRVHLTTAAYYLKRSTIDQYQGWQIIIHLILAGDWHTLTGFLIQLSLQLKDKRQAEAFELITLVFGPSLPEDMPVSSRIPFRAVQVRILMLLGKDAQALVTDLDTMMQGADISSLPMGFLAHLLVGPLNPAASPGMAARRTLEACRSYRRLPPEMQPLPLEPSLESLVWSGMVHIRSRDDIRGILYVLAAMIEQERRAAFSPDKLYEAAQIFVDQCWTLELTRAEEEQDWEGVLAIIDEIRQVGELPGGEPLQAAAARARAIVLADHLARPREALTILETALAGADHNARFLLQYTAGCILLDHSTPETALSRYQRALAELPTTYSTLQFDALRRAAEAAGRIGQWQTMRDLAISSLRVLRGNGLYYERLEMIGELAWAHWSLGDYIKACGAMSGVVHGLLRKQESDDNRFREVFGKTGHALGWMVSIAQSGAPPAHTPEGQPYTEPFPGFFSRPRPRIAEIAVPLLSSFLMTQLGMFAAACELDGVAWHNLSEAKNLAESQGVTYLRHFVDLKLADLAARREDYREAFHLTLSGIRSLPAGQRFRESGAYPLTAQISLEDIWAGLSQDQHQGLERVLYWTTIGPAITGLLAKEAHGEAYGAMITELQAIFQESEHELVDPEYWSHMLRQVRIAFSPLVTGEILRGQIQALREDELLLRVLYYLALSNFPNATLEESCQAQAAAFDFLLRTEPVGKLMAEDVAAYLLRFWTHVAETQAFTPHSARFRNIVRAIQVPTFPNIARLLIVAESATGARFSDELRRRLIEVIERE